MARDSVWQAKEVELKLAFEPGDAGRIASHPALSASLAPAQEQRLISTYFDTPDFTLHKAGVYLRVREIGGRYVQTVKTAKSKTDLIERLEWEREIAGRDPDLDGAEGTALQPLLNPQIRAALQPVFETRIRRTLYRIAQNGAEIEVAIDQGEIATRKHISPICELELELKRGETRELFRLARSLAEAAPLRLAVKTKAERGYELLEGGDLRLERAADIDIEPEMATADAFRAIAGSCLRQIIANEPLLCAGDAEGLHQMRIGLRRLRAAIAIFAGIFGGEEREKIKAELKWITGELGPARDLDAFATDVLEPLRASHPGDADLAATHRDFESKRKQAYIRAASCVKSIRFGDTILDLVEWIETGPWTTDDDKERKALRRRPAAKHANKMLTKLRRRVKRKGAGLRHLSVGQRHRLRISAKRLRYATEFFAATFPGEASAKRRLESLSALKDLQDSLGGLNDLATRHALIAGGLAAGKARLAAPETEDALLLKAEQAFARLAETKPFWKA